MSHLTDEDTQIGESPGPVPFKASKRISFDTTVSLPPLSSVENREDSCELGRSAGSVTLPPLSSDENREDPCDLGRSAGSGKARTSAHRQAVRVTVPQPEDVESTPANPSAVRPNHMMKIFLADDEIAEVTPEQVQRVRMMHERMEEGVNFSFNFNVLLLVASILAGLGLVSNSTATIIASMLVSPIMGPVVGLAYGTTISDWKLVGRSLRNETICLAFCIIMGMVIAGVTGPTSVAEDWPTAEMSNRGTMENFLFGLPIAFFSGLGVAVSLLDEQTASLVGVAISASLLPPAVNAGILWVAHSFTENEVIEYYQYGMVSLCLTVANIVLIWISACLMFKMKEVLPIKKNVFWDDLAVARKIYQRRALMQSFPLSTEPAAEECEMKER